MAHYVMFLYTAFYIGRVHELIDFLAPFRIVLILSLTGIVLTLALPRRRRNRVLRQPEVQIVLGLAAVAVVFTPFSIWPGGSWGFLTNTLSRLMVFFLLVVALATSAQAIHRLVWSVLTGSVVLGVYALLSGSALKTDYGHRIYASKTYDPNDLAMVMVCTLPLAAFAAVALRGIRRAVAVAVAAVCVLATIMTMSRGGFIGLIIVSLVLLFRLGTASIAPRVVILVTVVTFLAGAAPTKYWSLMSTIWNFSAGGEYTQSGVLPRVELWKRGVSLFLADPITGVGVGMFGVAEGLSHGGLGKWSTAHNSFVQLGTELGIFGFALFIALLVVSVRNARRVIRAARANPGLRPLAWTARAVETSLYAYVVVGFALSQAYSPVLYFLVALGAALRLQVERTRQPAATTAKPIAVPRGPRAVAVGAGRP